MKNELEPKNQSPKTRKYLGKTIKLSPALIQQEYHNVPFVHQNKVHMLL